MLILEKNRIELSQARRGVDNSELSSATGLCLQTLTRIKRGKPCKPETVYCIAKVLNVDPAELIKKE